MGRSRKARRVQSQVGEGRGGHKNGQKEGKFIWYGSIPPGTEAVLYSGWEVRAPVDAKWRVKSEQRNQTHDANAKEKYVACVFHR